jgi:hypothetical protein
MKHGKKSVGWEKCIQTKERIVRILLAASCMTFCAAKVYAQAPVVAIHDSELTRALETMPASPPTPTGGGATGYQWWPTDWHYFVMPESMQEALRSDGTPFTVIGDSNITAGLLLPNGLPKYPIVISLASEAIRDDEIAPLTNYVAAGGFLLVGSSAFTRNPNGTGRGDFAFANELGLHTATPGLTNWAFNQTITRRSNHRLVSHLPDGSLTWRMPSYSEETSWGISPSHQFLAPHDIWRAAVSDATVIAQGDGWPFLAVKPFGKGYFIYTAAFQPLIGHGGFAPGMYAYVIFRKAIEWAYESAREPVVKLSPWPFAYDSAFVVRHDLENFQNEIAGVEASAQVEHNNGIKGDYYFCTGTLRQDMGGSYDTNAVIASLQRAMTLYGATIGPHNGGRKNANNLSLAETDYDFWHWGPDEALDATPPGYINGKAYALASLSAAFSDIESWLPGLMTNGLRVWVAPSFNATREDSYDLQSQLGVKITGDQKLTPFPHWVVSTRTSGKRYTFLSEPVSDWFVGGLVAQSLEPWHPPGVQTSSTMHNAVDFYCGLGALINFYSHTLSTGVGDAGQLVPDYINYCLNTNLHPRLWPANAIDVYQWWQRRGAAQITPGFATSGNQSVASVGISGATDQNTTIELVLPANGAISNLQVRANGTAAPAGSYRTVGQTLKLRVGSSVTSAQISYVLLPAARNDLYTTQQGTALSVSAPGVLANDSPGMGTSLTATLVSGPANGAVNLNGDGSFTYTPNSGFSGSDSFTYRVSNGVDSSSAATVQISVMPAGVLFADDFTSATDPGPIDPWVSQDGTWMLTGGQLSGQSSANNYGNAYYTNGQWSDYTVEGRIRFSSANGFGGGLGGHLNPSNGAHYGAWIYPDASSGGPNVLRLIKFEGWTTWSFTPMAGVNLPPVGTNWHTLALTFQGANISVSFDDSQVISTTDNNFDSVPAYLSGGITVDMYSDSTSYNLFADDILVTTPVSATPPTITSQPASVTANAGSAVMFSVTASGTAPLSYSWFKNGTTRLSDGGNVSGSATPTLTLANVTASDGGDYIVVVSNQAGTVTSSPARLTVITSTPPAIVSQPQSQTVNAGQSASFSVTATGTAPLSYAWTKNGTRLSDGGNITGSSTPTLTVANVGAADAGNYAVIVSNQAGSVVSSPATLTVITSTPPSIVSQPQSQTVIAGQSASFSVSASGTAPLRYQWRRNGANIAGATASTYTLANAQPANAGQYTVVVSNNGGVATSAPATLTVNYSLTVTTSSGGSVSIQPYQNSYAPGTSVTLKATPSFLFKFTGWSGNATGTANPLTIPMNGNKQIKANFALLGLLGLP